MLIIFKEDNEMKKASVKACIPLLPAVSMKDTVQFYKDLGFVNTYEGEERSSNYAVMINDYLEIHIYGYKKLAIPTSTNSYLYKVEDVDTFYELLKSNFKKANGKFLSRTGLPRIGMPRYLKYDRRFTITDPKGNYLIFAEEYEAKVERPIKTKFEELYWESHTLAYSHESPLEAKKMLERAISRADLQQENPNIVFQCFVLLTDAALLLNNPEDYKIYLEKSSHFFNKLENKELDKNLLESIKQFQNFKQ